MTTLEKFQTNKETIIEKTLEQIINALRGDRVNRHFFFDGENVDYSISSGQIALDDDYFFSIKDHQTIDAGDYGYDSDESMLDDEQFIDDQYREQIELAIDNHINKLECYA